MGTRDFVEDQVRGWEAPAWEQGRPIARVGPVPLPNSQAKSYLQLRELWTQKG